jgi:hypothetical protein
LRYRPKPAAEKKRLLEEEIVKMSREHPTLLIVGMCRALPSTPLCECAGDSVPNDDFKNVIPK